ncbi:outer membrane protein assembly factor BamD [Mizugakiibacter sediminis]|uniref:Outer membrane protein assembly factor BamD n=1 Tax=Mizugakiibacter sediminis TaxID=1475481 RepID=A0A0K8QPI5_9GAMM|nr:outer membrane protein assembly factor BamD [Mizugakiibacter sediminis]GAP66322.1 outer membrane protein assembly factor BamD [Mizugakiibacter sediminis]
MRVAPILRLPLLVLLVLLVGCSHFGKNKRDEAETAPVEEVYAKAKQSLEIGNYGRAEKAYQRLIARFPFGPYTEQSELEMAYAQYKSGKPDDAYSTINRFIKTYPTNKHIDYAYYLRGLINFNRTGSFLENFVKRDKSRRDPGYAVQAFNDFSDLVSRYPNSRYANDARQRMIFLRNGLAQYELNIAMYYLRIEAYIAAADRAEYIIEHYQQTPQAADALAVMTKAYRKLGQDKLADDTERVLKLNYPNHPYLANPKHWPKRPSTLRRLIPLSGHY